MSELPSGTVTLLFSDIQGSTALLKRLGDGWPGVLERQRALLRESIDAGGGVVVDCQGDAMFAAFRSARGATAAAASAQVRMADEEWPDGTAVRVRMALHCGEPHRTDDGTYTGIDVVRAARLCAAAHGGQVLMTEAARLLSDAQTIDLGTAQLRDIDGPERVHQLVGRRAREELPAAAYRGGHPAGDVRPQRRRLRGPHRPGIGDPRATDQRARGAGAREGVRRAVRQALGAQEEELTARRLSRRPTRGPRRGCRS